MRSRLKAHIRKSKIKQKDIAKQIGISEQLMSDFVNGSSDIARNNFFKLADALEISLDELRLLMEHDDDSVGTVQN